MGLTKYNIGYFVEPYNEKCGIANLLPDQISGINIDKEFFEPARQVGDDTSNYKIVPSDYFACNLMHVGRDEVLPIALNHSKKNKVVSPAYTVFKLKHEDLLLKEYFFILLKSSEKDRYFWFHTDSSIRQGLSWEDFCDIDITLPSIEVQRKFVDVYMALQKNLESYQSRVDDLKLVCDGYIDQLKKKCKKETIGEYIIQCDERNADNKYTLENLRGISIQKVFIDTKADMMDVSLSPYILVKPKYFAFVPVTSRNGDKITIAYNDSEDTYIVSSAYNVFDISDKDKLDPEYLFMYLSRPEFDRYARFNSWGSAREVFTMDDMKDVKIPIPNIGTQRDIVKIHRCYIERQRIASQLKEQLNKMCPILIKGSLETNN
ncbi:restriction endonuclease subunit S [Prevotella sp. E15-22]|uniref:restriction endonuclease subunit S n=1 Tax=Prevotella sp. E15-22 TaxID=2937774 RepID=UPI002069C22A|nr:restriction endonuclease subunit S [Prevotella sp. E15-22]UPS45564.1 restriction endonuclease subunit S [Prevotella sp. E15-22]